jgi:hypothetical protein
MAIDDDMIAAAVHSGNYSDPAAGSYLTETLSEPLHSAK